MFAGIAPSGIPSSRPEIAHIKTDFTILLFPTSLYRFPHSIVNVLGFSSSFPRTYSMKLSILKTRSLSFDLLENDAPPWRRSPAMSAASPTSALQPRR